MTAAPAGEILVVLSSADLRGAEIEGLALTQRLTAHGVDAAAVALAAGSGRLSVPVLGRSTLGPATLRALRRRARSARVVIAYGSSTLPASATALIASGVPFMYRSIGDPTSWVRGGVHRARTALFYRRAAHVVALWPGAAAAIGRLYGVRESRRSVVPNARDHRAFTPPSAVQRRAARAELSIDDATTVVALIGSLNDEKRPALAAEATHRVPEATLLVVGDGPRRQQLESMRADGIRLRLLGWQADVRPALHAADVIVSTSATEGMPGSLIEAALCAVPAVAIDVGATADVVGEGGFVLGSAAGPAEIASALARAVDHAVELGAAARQHAVDRFSWDAVLPAWLEVLAGWRIDPTRQE